MALDSGSLSAIFVSLATLLTWLVAQARSTTQSQRREIRRLRAVDLLKDRYIHRLEHALAREDLPLPDKPEGWEVFVDAGEAK